MDLIDIIYLVCFFLGFGFAVISALLSHAFSGGADAHVDMGGVHGDVGGAEAADGGAVHFSPLSPVTLSMFVATFGGAGMIYKKLLDWPTAVHIPLAAVSGLVIAGLVFLLFYKIFSVTQASSETRAAEVVGLEAEVTVSIPPGGLGQIAYTMRDSRQTSPATAADGGGIPERTPVKVVNLSGNTYVVRKI